MNIILRTFLCAAGTGFCFLFGDLSAQDSRPAEPVNQVHEQRMAELHTLLEKKGFDIDTHFTNPSFQFHSTIDAQFKKSAETTGYVNYTKVARTADISDSAKAAAYEKELAAYKRKVGYAAKQRGIAKFINDHRTQLTLCEEKYGVPKEVISAVIGMESTFGKVTGKYYAFNVYVSMYVCGYRQEFALSQIEELLKYTKRKNIDMFSLRSSYGGAMGNMQFIPSSLNRWFVGDDLTDMDDTIASVANYLGHFFKREGTIEQAVYRYNTSMFYTRTVLDLAEYARTIEIASRR